MTNEAGAEEHAKIEPGDVDQKPEPQPVVETDEVAVPVAELPVVEAPPKRRQNRPYVEPVNRKFSTAQALAIRERRAAGEKVITIAKEFNVCRHTVQRLCAGRFYPAPEAK